MVAGAVLRGGLTGDVYGAVNESVETAVLTLACFLPVGFLSMPQFFLVP